MKTQARTSLPLSGASKFARVMLTGILAIGMSVMGLSSASALTPQTITFADLADMTVGDADQTPTAISDSELPITFTSTTLENCTIVDGKIHAVAAGACSITASQAGNEVFDAAVDVVKTLTILASPAITSAAISGTAKVGQVLTATATGITGSPEPTISYQWKSDGTNVGTNAATYTLTEGDLTKTITVVITASNGVGIAATATSPATAAVAAADADTAVAGEALTTKVTAPVRAATPSTTAVTGTGFTGAVAWFGSDGTTPVSGSFAATTVYKAKVTLTATTGYTLTGLTGTFTYADATSVDYADGVVTITFAATAAAPAVVAAATSSGDGGAAAAAAAKAAADKAAADKAAADKLAAEKAVADKAAADKVAADKVAAEKIAVEKAAVEKAETEARAAAEAVVKAEEAKVAAAVVKAAAVTVKPVVSKSGTKLTLDLPDKYYGKIVTVYVGTTVKGKTTYKKLDFFVLDKEDGTANITSKVKLVKGQVIRVNVGSTVVKSVKI
ncbi:hypothetical protein MCERE3_00974 [Candidatus Nanopelagicaceae bacterium]